MDHQMLDVSQIPKDWRYKLKRLKRFDKSAILAGGALRDLWHGKKHKDLDYFCSPKIETFDARLDKVFDGLHWTAEVGYDNVRMVRRVADATITCVIRDGNTKIPGVPAVMSEVQQVTEDIVIIDGHEWIRVPVNLVVVGCHVRPTKSTNPADTPLTPMQIIEGFDIGLCQIAFDGEKIHTTERFLKDSRDRTMTIYESQSLPASKKRFIRINRRYGYKLKISSAALVAEVKRKWAIGQNDSMTV